MMLVYALALAVVAGYLRGGRLANYERRPLRMVGLPITAFAVEALYGAALGTGLDPALLLSIMVPLQYALLAAFCALNWRRKPVLPIALGTALNLLVIGLNGFRMPVTAAIRDVPEMISTLTRIESGELFEYVVASAETRLLWLGDVIPAPFLPGQGFGSIGDLLLAAGVGWLVMEIMGRREAGERKSMVSS